MEVKVNPDTQLEDGSEQPPFYSNNTAQPDAQQETTFSEPKPYPTQSYYEQPPSYDYGGSKPADIPQPSQISSTTIQATPTVTVVTSQPTYNSRVYRSSRRGGGGTERLFVVTLVLAIFCAVCGSPLTLVCFVPAIFLSRKVWL